MAEPLEPTELVEELLAMVSGGTFPLIDPNG
jgi:hypothetical protein